MEWISVKDRMPEVEIRVRNFKQCLVVNDGNTQWATFNGKTKRFQDSSFFDITKQVTHWMPLPEPPTEGT